MLNLEPWQIISYIVVLLIAFPVHEFAHAWTANYFGDDTPRINGRLTLNPLSHLDPIGSLLLIVAGFGWAKPVPVNPYALERRSPAALMLVSLAGPVSNFLMAILVAIPIRLGLITLDFSSSGILFLPTISQLLFVFVSTNLLLMLFNLIPVAPLDGEKIAVYFLPPNLSRYWDTIRPFGPLILIVLVYFGAIERILIPALSALMSLLVG